jgi:hypothetical protein
MKTVEDSEGNALFLKLLEKRLEVAWEYRPSALLEDDNMGLDEKTAKHLKELATRYANCRYATDSDNPRPTPHSAARIAYGQGYIQAIEETRITKEQASEIWAAASSYKWRGFDHWWAEYQKEQEK